MKMLTNEEQSKAQVRLRYWERTYRRDSLTGLLNHAAFRSDVELKLLEGKEKIMMPYRKVQDIEISQNMLERIINVGDILIYGGHDNSDTILDDIPDPKSAEEIILSHISDYNEYPPNYPPNYNPNYYNNGYNRNYGYDDRYDNREYDDRYDYHEYNRYEENNQAPPIENRNYYRDDNDYSHEQENNSQNNSFINKWNKNKQKYKKSKMNKDEIMERHQRMFKKYNE